MIQSHKKKKEKKKNSQDCFCLNVQFLASISYNMAQIFIKTARRLLCIVFNMSLADDFSLCKCMQIKQASFGQKMILGV